MASIKKRLDQGIMPTLTNDIFYSEEPLKFNNLQDIISFHDDVKRNFESLPSELRKKMGNNIHNFEAFVHDPNNAALLAEHGLITKRDASNSDVVNSLNEIKKTLDNQPDNKVIKGNKNKSPDDF